MLCIVPASVKVTGMARRRFEVDTELYTVVLPSVLVVPLPWVTVTVLVVTPVPETVTVADLGLAPVFADVAVQVIVPLFVPVVGDTVSQLPSSVIFQEVFDVILNVPDDPDAEPNETLVGDTLSASPLVV